MPKEKKNKDTGASKEFAPADFKKPSVEDKPAKAPAEKLVAAPVFGRKPSERRKAQSRKMTFDQYARAKGFREHHVPGLRAHCDNPNKLRTATEWDEHLKDY